MKKLIKITRNLIQILKKEHDILGKEALSDKEILGLSSDKISKEISKSNTILNDLYGLTLGIIDIDEICKRIEDFELEVRKWKMYDSETDTYKVSNKLVGICVSTKFYLRSIR